ncbi:MAG TPA: tRNA pseudouridine(55) synthase TruB [Aestuariivirga sp.]
MKRQREKINGWIAFDKPYGMTSTQAVGKLRNMFNAEKAGHGGTLDPLATGLLPIAFGEATKTVQWAMDGAKIYRFTAAWGAETNTDDLEGEITKRSDERPNRADIEAILPQFTGTILQAPPAYSAIKIDGERAYDLARAGEVVEMKEREVHVDSLKLVKAAENHADFEITCGKGTYIRSLARDMGRKLGCLAHVSALRRLKVGGLQEAQMISLEKLEKMAIGGATEALKGALLPLETVLDGIPALAVLDTDAAKLRQGQTVLLRGANAPISEAAVLIRCDNQPIAIGEISQGFLKTKRLFNL